MKFAFQGGINHFCTLTTSIQKIGLKKSDLLKKGKSGQKYWIIYSNRHYFFVKKASSWFLPEHFFDTNYSFFKSSDFGDSGFIFQHFCKNLICWKVKKLDFSQKLDFRNPKTRFLVPILKVFSSKNSNENVIKGEPCQKKYFWAIKLPKMQKISCKYQNSISKLKNSILKPKNSIYRHFKGVKGTRTASKKKAWDFISIKSYQPFLWPNSYIGNLVTRL